MPAYSRVLLGIGGAGAAYLYFKPRPKPFHIKVEQPERLVGGVNVIPIITGIVSSLPESLKRKLMVSQQAPNPEKEVRDRFDLTGKSPYVRIEEVKEGKIWNIAYEMENMVFTDLNAMEGFKMLGVDLANDKFADKVKESAAKYGEEMARVAEADMSTAKEWSEKAEKGEISTEEIFKLPPWALNTIVVRLNSGGLMLFAPVKIQEEMADWLAERGTVQWVVLPSSAHTLSLPNVVKRFPDAKVVGPEQAEAKLQHCKALPRGKFDFLTTDATDMEALNNILAEEGVFIHNVAGDVVTQSNVVVAHKTILECDLVYGHADREGCTNVGRERFWQMLPEDWFHRIFKFALIDSSPDGGCLPAYRFWLMDPNSMGAMGLDSPAKDGSSCLAMAESLRTALDLDFDSAAGVHIDLMTRAEFRAAINCSWKWLDGKSLLREDDPGNSS
jgi:hypothetical protein